MADVTDSKSVAREGVWVQVPLPAPKQYNPNQIFPVGDGFGLFVYFDRYEKAGVILAYRHLLCTVVASRCPDFMLDPFRRP